MRMRSSVGNLPPMSVSLVLAGPSQADVEMRMTRTQWIRCVASLVAWLLAAATTNAQSPARADSTPPERPLRVLAVGGLLGQFDGYCEHPGGPYDLELQGVSHCQPGGPGGDGPAITHGKWPAALGGLLGVERWVRSDRQHAARLVLMTGNNQTPDFADEVLVALKGDRSPATQDVIRPPVATSAVQQTRQAQLVTPDTGAIRSKIFWRRLRTLMPHAVALGPEDFIRSLRASIAGRSALPNGAAGRFVRWVRHQMAAAPDETGGLPLLASNVVIRTTSKGLNTLKDADGFELMELSADSSVDWLSVLTVTHPCREIPAVFLRAEGEDATGPLKIDASAAPSDCKTTFEVPGGHLRPSTRYEVLRHGRDGTPQSFATFVTHRALTPHRGTAGADRWPMIAAEVRGRDDGPPRSVLVLNLLSQSLSKELGQDAWRWRNPHHSGGESTPDEEACGPAEDPKATCTIDIVEPAKALKALLATWRAETGAEPFVVLMSSMDDDDTSEVLEMFPEVRLAVLPPDSALLGRMSRAAAKETAQPKSTQHAFSGDLGMVGVLDAAQPAHTRVIARPDWLGATGTVVDLRLRVTKDGGDTIQRVRVAQASADTIAGSTLGTRRLAGGISYIPTMEPELASGVFRPYESCTSDDTRPRCVAFRSIWQQDDVLSAVIGHALRTHANADVVALPDSIIDPDETRFLPHALKEGATDWLTRFTVHRLVFRSPRFVTADVAGDKLGPILQQLTKDGAYCVVGLEFDGCQTELSATATARARPLGRALRPGFFYKLVLPDSKAEELDLAHSDSDPGADLIEALDAYLLDDGKDGWYPTAWSATEASPTFKSQLANAAAGATRRYLSVTDAELGWSGLDVSIDGGGEAIPNNLDIENRGARSFRTVSAAVTSELGVIDLKRFALRQITELAYTRRRVFGNEYVSYDRDRFLMGIRADLWKWRSGGDVRPYLGVFSEGPFQSQVSIYTATRDTTKAGESFNTEESAQFLTPFRVRRNVFLYGAMGADALVTSLSYTPVRWFESALKRLKVEYSNGRANRVPLDVLVAPSPGVEGVSLAQIGVACPAQDLTDSRRGDAPALLNEYFECYREGLTKDSRLVLDTEQRHQQRLHLEAEASLTFKGGERKYVLTVTGQRRQFWLDGPLTDLAVRRTWRVKAQFAIPLMWRLELAPTYEYQRAQLFGSAPNRFGVHVWDLKVKVPVFFSLGRGGMVQ
jgi:hypothetical protein